MLKPAAWRAARRADGSSRRMDSTALMRKGSGGYADTTPRLDRFGFSLAPPEVGWKQAGRYTRQKLDREASLSGAAGALSAVPRSARDASECNRSAPTAVKEGRHPSTEPAP